MTERFQEYRRIDSGSGQVTLAVLCQSLEFCDLLVMSGWASLITAGFCVHITAGLLVIGGGAMLNGIQAGRP